MSILEKIKPGCVIGYDGKEYKVRGKALYITENDQSSAYAKILLEDHHVLVIASDTIYFGKCVGEISEFDTNALAQRVSYQGNLYEQVNSDYQLVLNLEFGSPVEVEGEVKFWDYEAEEMIISIAVVSRNKYRADVVAKYINENDLTVG